MQIHDDGCGVVTGDDFVDHFATVCLAILKLRCLTPEQKVAVVGELSGHVGIRREAAERRMERERQEARRHD